ncbi:S-adenosyl-L-methionine-dependent methyltransferase [Macrophomina phaseolina]|uniref:tRNA (adenine(58)-N(1))-methyltransferase catalytic subunit TRM61 n=1 Tax=Macrophomina phaseolina TaxID=35725 RepID=A0ABQ8GSE6_9PEZI|nr:S-adenosyl-L-methionine-dependent methyltransferase [Macrophomina phaseolina]
MHPLALARRPSALLPRQLCRPCCRALATPARSKVFAEGDVVLLRDKNRPRNPGILTSPLKPGAVITKQDCQIPHDAIIGRAVRDTIPTRKTEYRIQDPTLDEYVRMTPRIVTPIYPKDASFIVSLFDIHVSPAAPSAPPSPPLEILEAGTGHGGLTLHLARAIHGANPPLSASLRVEHASTDPDHSAEDVTYESTTTDYAVEHTFEAWRRNRRAVVHTLDNKPRHTDHARKIVRRFRRGMYANDVDFHVDDVSSWIKARFEAQKKGETWRDAEPFLSYVFLDLPSAENHVEIVSKALHVDGALAVFNPSITQIADVVQRVKELKLPLALDNVIELKGSDTVREWDVRVSQLKAARRAANSTSLGVEGIEEAVSIEEDVAQGSEKGASLAKQAVEEAQDLIRREREQDEGLESSEDDDWKLICRPKTGLTMGVGGFVGLWRRTKSS